MECESCKSWPVPGKVFANGAGVPECSFHGVLAAPTGCLNLWVDDTRTGQYTAGNARIAPFTESRRREAHCGRLSVADVLARVGTARGGRVVASLRTAACQSWRVEGPEEEVFSLLEVLEAAGRLIEYR